MKEQVIERNGKILLCTFRDGRMKERLLAIRESEDVLVIKKKSSLIFKSTNSIGFNLEMVERMPFKRIRVELDSGEVLTTTKYYLLNKGVRMQFEPYEKQLALEIKAFGLQNALDFERGNEFKKRIITHDLYSGLGIERPRRQS
jgi:hypothetical protein